MESTRTEDGLEDPCETSLVGGNHGESRELSHDRSAKTNRVYIPADTRIRREVQTQLNNYFKRGTRMMDFDTQGGKTREVFYHDSPSQPACTRHGKCWKTKIIKSIDETVSQLDLDEIWKFHDHRRAGKLMHDNVVQNYSRRPGNILHAPKYRQWYLAKSRSGTTAT